MDNFAFVGKVYLIFGNRDMGYFAHPFHEQYQSQQQAHFDSDSQVEDHGQQEGGQ